MKLPPESQKNADALVCKSSMEDDLLDNMDYGQFRANIYRTPEGSFKVTYTGPDGKELDSDTYNGISHYQQKQAEIEAKLRQLWEKRDGSS